MFYIYTDYKMRDHFAARPEPNSQELWDCVELNSGELFPLWPIQEGRF
jgi:hypothetical protein